jgi:hypothetical protein
MANSSGHIKNIAAHFTCLLKNKKTSVVIENEDDA